jgi:site-specific DNA-methyltransferase (adenine-specific)
MNFELYNGDCLDELKKLPDNSIDSCVTDPPYGLSFMGNQWDYDVPSADIWREVLRVLKPGAHLLAFFGSRTYHRGAIKIEDAGFEIRDQIMWLYGSGFPKAGNLKPAHEPIVVARKSFSGSRKDNVEKFGTGGLNIDDCRLNGGAKKWTKPRGGIWKTDSEAKAVLVDNPLGRYPANVIHDGAIDIEEGRFFYCAKASKADRDEGLEQFLAKKVVTFQTGNGASGNASSLSADRNTEYKNIHPTVKPTDLMKYLVKLVTQKGGTVLDPFMGSGSTGKACGFEDYKFIGIERDAEYFEIAKVRIEHAYQNKIANLEEFFTD